MSDDLFPLTLYYDASCPLCMAEMRNLMLRNIGQRLRFVDASAADFEAPEGFSRATLMRLLHAQAADGRWLVGVDVFMAMYEAVGVSWVTRALGWRWLRPLADAAYPWVAANRYRVPHWLVLPVFERALRRAAQARSRSACAAGVCGKDAS